MITVRTYSFPGENLEKMVGIVLEIILSSLGHGLQNFLMKSV